MATIIQADPDWFTFIVENDYANWDSWLNNTPNLNCCDSQGMTPLHWACLLQKDTFATDLLVRGANPWSLDNEGYFPFQIAMNHKIETSWQWNMWPTFFKEAFSAIELMDENSLSYISHAILHFLKQKQYNEIKVLLSCIPFKKCKQLTIKHNGGTIPWPHVAVLLDSHIFLDAIIDWGCPINVVDNNRYNVMEFAAILQKPLMIEHLIKLGANPMHQKRNSPVFNNALELARIVSADMAVWVEHALQKTWMPKTIQSAQLQTIDLDHLHGQPEMAKASVKAIIAEIR